MEWPGKWLCPFRRGSGLPNSPGYQFAVATRACCCLVPKLVGMEGLHSQVQQRLEHIRGISLWAQGMARHRNKGTGLPQWVMACGAMGCMTEEGGSDLGQAVKLSLVSPPSQATPWWLVAWGHGRTGEVHSDRGHGCSMCSGGEGRCWGLQWGSCGGRDCPPHPRSPHRLLHPSEPPPINPTHRGHRRGAAHQGFIGVRDLRIPSAGSEVSLKVPLLSATPVLPPWLPAPCATLCPSHPSIPSIAPDPHPQPLTPLSPLGPWCPSPLPPIPGVPTATPWSSPNPVPTPVAWGCVPPLSPSPLLTLGLGALHAVALQRHGNMLHSHPTCPPCHVSVSVWVRSRAGGALERRDHGAKRRQGLPHGTQS